MTFSPILVMGLQMERALEAASGLEFLLPVLLSAGAMGVIAIALVFESSVYQLMIL
jgi:hypothetical protein